MSTVDLFLYRVAQVCLWTGLGGLAVMANYLVGLPWILVLGL